MEDDLKKNEKMEDDLRNKNKNGRRPQKNGRQPKKKSRAQKKKKNEDDLKKNEKNEDDLKKNLFLIPLKFRGKPFFGGLAQLSKIFSLLN